MQELSHSTAHRIIMKPDKKERGNYCLRMNIKGIFFSAEGARHVSAAEKSGQKNGFFFSSALVTVAAFFLLSFAHRATLNN